MTLYSHAVIDVSEQFIEIVPDRLRHRNKDYEVRLALETRGQWLLTWPTAWPPLTWAEKSGPLCIFS